MGTKADFYIKRDSGLEWHGSVEWDAKIEQIPKELLQSSSEYEFKENLQKLMNRPNARKPENGWPWYWDSSKHSDYAYIMWENKGQVFISQFNSPAFTFYQYQEYKSRYKKAEQNGTDIEDFNSYLSKIASFVPMFPRMKNSI